MFFPHTLVTPRSSFAEVVPEVLGDGILKFLGERKGVGFGGKFLPIFPSKNRLSTCHRKLHHILHRKQRDVSPELQPGGVLAYKSYEMNCLESLDNGPF